MFSERRRQDALARIRRHLQDMEYHTLQARSERSKARALVRTWGLCPAGLSVDCCGNPDGCEES